MATKKNAPKRAAKPVVKTVKKAAAHKSSVMVAPKKAVSTKKAAKKNIIHKPAVKSVVKKAASKKAVVKASKSIENNIMKKAAPAKQTKTKQEEIKETKSHQKTTAQPAEKPKAAEAVKEVKAPKTTIKTSVPYQPDYKPLDQRKEILNRQVNEPLVRYTDSELNDFRELINKKLDAAKKELAYLQGLITRKDDMGGDETENRYMTMEDGGMSMEREQLSQMASRQITYIDHLEKALIRIENKTYGICRVTGKLIDKARLRAVPHATLSLEAKLGLVRSGNE